MFTFGQTSLSRLIAVDPRIVTVAKHALTITTQDFGVGEGKRSAETQLRDWQRHTSKLNGIPIGTTRNGIRGTGVGEHQLGRALDLVPYVNGIILWNLPPDQQWQYIYPVADAMRAAAIAEKINVRWGGVWDKPLNSLAAGPAAIEAALKAYEARHAGVDFIDGPHFELIDPPPLA